VLSKRDSKLNNKEKVQSELMDGELFNGEEAF
jgi:hypothetical protein